jgi:CheY-like chemotaxis protein
LLSNAIKYNRPGGRIRVRAQLRRPDVGAPRVDIAVDDTGIGIAPANLVRLFTPFDRFGAATRGIDGTGIGLALSQRLMLMMDGNLRATSELGRGSTFTASLPVTEPPEWALSRVGADAPAVGRGDQNGTRQMCLVYFQDNGISHELMKSIISRRPHWRMLVADSEASGHDEAMAERPELVLLDLHAPGVNVVDVIKRLRADPITQDLNVVVVSSDANPRDINRLLRAGANGYLSRPLVAAEIVDVLDSCATSSTRPCAT